MIGKHLGHFRITAKLGEGGMGEVYRAEDGKLGREVAIKVLPQAFVADPERLARFQREARVLATLNHPHIAGIYEVGEDDGVHFLVMELTEGRTLDRRLAEGPLPLDEALPWALQIARALEEAHERGIVHRDLKPLSSTIVTRHADGTGGRTPVFDGAGYGLWQGLAMFAPGGRHFVAAVDEGGRKFLRIADVDGSGGLSEPRPFFSFEPDPSVLDARISPDGSMLAYTSSDSGRPEVYLTRFPEGEGRWQVSFDGGRRPRWAAQTGELFFLSGTDPSTRALSVVEVETSPSIGVGTPRELFRLAAGAAGSEGPMDLLTGSDDAFDVTPDGERFVMVRASTARGFTPRMVLVQNWRRELAQR